MEADSSFSPVLLAGFDISFVIISVVICILLVLSALVSGSEVAFFSLSPKDRDELELEKNRSSDILIALLDRPKRLLATILIANNFINVGIVILSTALMDSIFKMTSVGIQWQFLINVIAVTFVILLIGEVIPKVYATKNGYTFAKFMARPINIARMIFRPLAYLLVSSTSFIDKRIKKKSHDISVDHLEHALELTSEELTDDGKESQILRGIVKFGSTDVKQIMTPRLDTVILDIETPYSEIRSTILELGYSRIPVFKDNIDSILGVLYIKDLLPHLNAEDDFDWSVLLRNTYYVPENKKIDDLLREFQENKVHIALVVDEYGGTSGIVTFEDIIEEIVGEISDEFDDDDIVYSKLDDSNYVFEGKTPLIDVYRIIDIEGDEFEDVKGESDTLAGFLMEISGKILRKNEKVKFNNYEFTIEAADKRRVKQIKMTIYESEETD